MGAQTTIRITRSAAKAKVVQYLFEDATTESIEALMDSILYDRLYNVKIVSDDEENDNQLIFN